jgi:hypothetical protein
MNLSPDHNPPDLWHPCSARVSEEALLFEGQSFIQLDDDECGKAIS